MTSVRLTATEHLHKSGRWNRCAQLFFHNSDNIDFDERIHISGLLTPLYLYQVFEVFMMFEMKLFQDKDYNADNMRLEKVHCTSNSWIFWAILNLMIDYWNVESYLPKPNTEESSCRSHCSLQKKTSLRASVSRNFKQLSVVKQCMFIQQKVGHWMSL